MSRRTSANRFVFLLLAFLVGSACSQETGDSGSTGLVELSLGEAEIKVELAIERSEQTRGLMHRRSMPADQGMLFVYASPTRMSFWMRNTYIPLDIGFFTKDGVLREVHKMYPHDENPVKSLRQDILYALEMNQGWFQEHGIKPGTSFDLDELLNAINR